MLFPKDKSPCDQKYFFTSFCLSLKIFTITFLHSTLAEVLYLIRHTHNIPQNEATLTLPISARINN